jgi:DNA-binding NtrC family response regulator
VRELRNAVARRIALGHLAGDVSLRPSTGAAKAAAASPDFAEHVLSLGLPLTASRDMLVEDFERRYIERMLERHEGNPTRAAAASGIARRYFQLLRSKRIAR